MLIKVPQKGLKLILAASIVSFGSISNIPTVFAEGERTSQGQTNEAAAMLTSLEIDGIKLDQTFTPELKKYTATVDNEVQSIQLTAKSETETSQISFNEKSVSNGKSVKLELQSGENNFLIKVKNGSNTTIYTLTVTRKLDHHNLLQNLKLSTGELSPVFSPTVTDYKVQVKNEISALTVIPSAAVNTAKVTVNHSPATAKGVEVKIPVGTTEVNIVVTAENGESITYTLHITREKEAVVTKPTDPSTPLTGSAPKPTGMETASGQQKSGQTKTSSGTYMQTTGIQQTATTTKATLSALTVSTGTWDSDFESDEFTYHIAVSSDVNTVTIKPTAQNSGSSITIEGGTSRTIPLDADNKTIISVVVKYDNSDRKTYVLEFDKTS
ncbi:cadherin-like beta sandwich domain-containing protein [Neobacillus sp. LXY-1]|uniref:cadherin-like beta sandwich domain-containing protein n=1 Tax=Neobacillus sp. LXY-1 TaxID=3379133 RepID=UPI003EE1E433